MLYVVFIFLGATHARAIGWVSSGLIPVMHLRINRAGSRSRHAEQQTRLKLDEDIPSRPTSVTVDPVERKKRVNSVNQNQHKTLKNSVGAQYMKRQSAQQSAYGQLRRELGARDWKAWVAIVALLPYGCSSPRHTWAMRASAEEREPVFAYPSIVYL